MGREQDEAFMRRALALADKAAALGEVPVGAVIVKDGEIIAEAYNRRESDKNALAHAEVLAIDRACAKLGGWRLHQCELYVTLEPCPMCAGAIVNARLKRVVAAAKDEKAGAFGSVMNLNRYPLNHHPGIEFGVLENEARERLHAFFGALRERQRRKKQESGKKN